MKVNIGVFAHNSNDWDRVMGGEYSRPADVPDWKYVQAAFALADLAEPLGFDGIWAPEHQGTPYAMTPNPIQTLTYFAGRTERVTFGTMVAVAPWWNPVRLAHQIAYLDIISNGRYTTIGLGRGVAKSEFDAVGVPREEARQRLLETLDILELAFTQERFSYDGEIFRIPEMSIRPAPLSTDLHRRLFSSSSSPDSREILARRGMVPLFVGNKPIDEAAKEVREVNTFRAEEGLGPCQPKNVLMMYCAPKGSDVSDADDWLLMANRDVNVHYGYADPANFVGVKGYESYAARRGRATAVMDEVSARKLRDGRNQPKLPGYHPSNLMIGSPDEVYHRIMAAQASCSFSEIAIVPQFGTMPYEEAMKSVRLFAEEVLPALQRAPAPLQPGVLLQPLAEPPMADPAAKAG
jgi:alkanesulfonate monooxygenase SsuD/methylene tetrahydromethanopterin reductase-like flavin-dependent oxidoreductase (luciferase family)